MAEYISYILEIKRRPSSVHLLCPKEGVNDVNQYDVDESPASTQSCNNEERDAKINAARSRRKKFISSLQLLAYDGPESEQYQRYIWDQLDEALGACDLCIREYYVAKIGLAAELKEDYEEEEVKSFFSLIDRRDIERIKRGLDGATQKLRGLPEQKRSMSGLDPTYLHAVYEALICEAFLSNETLLQKHFDEPFKLLHTKKKPRIQEYLPAVTAFLFQTNELRHDWATTMWSHLKRAPNDLEWTWTMKGVLQSQLQAVGSPNAVKRLWSALRMIVDKLDEAQITHGLFDLVPNVCTTALNHLAKPTAASPHIVRTMQRLLEKAPIAFWQAFGPISPTTVAEQIFSSPDFNTLLQQQINSHPGDGLDVDLLCWTMPLLRSLKPANQVPLCHTFSLQLFERAESPTLSQEAKILCHEVVVRLLLHTLLSFSDNEAERQSVDRVVLCDLLNIISHRIDALLKPPQSTSLDGRAHKIRGDVLSVVRNSLALECQCLKSDFEALSRSSGEAREMTSYSPDIWNAVLHNLNVNDVKLSKAALLGVMALPGLEKFRSREPNQLSKEKQAFNSVFEKITAMEARVLERLANFNTEHLEELFKAQDVSMSLVAALFSADPDTYESAVELFKNLSGQSGRREAIAYVLDAFPGTTVYGLSWVLRRIANLKTFAPVPRMLRTGMDVLEVLCSTQDGLLRNKTLTHRDAQAIQSYWSYQWAALRTVFQYMEKWSLEVHDKPKMTEICRDAMQYAGALFEEYNLFASALGHARPEHASDISQALLDSSSSATGSPIKTLDAMSKWLRLRDEYLAETIVKLIANMLSRLRSRGVVAVTEGLSYVEDVAIKSNIRTMLSSSQKAELIRALENYYGREIEKPAPKIKKQSTLRAWTDAGTPESTNASTPVSVEQNEDEYGDNDLLDDDFEVLSDRHIDANKGITSKAMREKRIASMLRQDSPKPGFMDKRAFAAEKKVLDNKAFIEERKKQIAAAKLKKQEEAARLRSNLGIGGQTKGQGSGVSALGVRGKDHSLGKSDMMVSSSSESDSDEDDDIALFGTSVKTVQKVAAPGPPRVVPTKKVKQQRSHKDIRARLAPDLSPLHKTILSWDFFADTDLPPSSQRTDYTLVSNTFRTVLEYQQTFEPLLVLEGWQAFRSAREDGNFRPFEIKVNNSLIVDSFVEISSAMPIPTKREDRPPVSVADVVLLSKSKTPIAEPNEAHCIARVKEVTYKKGELIVVYRIISANNPMRPYLNDKSVVFGATLMSLTPLEREYGALMALQYYDLADEVIRARPSPLPPYSNQQLQKYMDLYDVNQAQAKAVASALDNDAFTLIQGPPGSGKTKTICAIVGSMLTAPSRSTAAATSNQGGVRLPPSSNKILICAPSNAAVDELVMRFMDGVKLNNGSVEHLSIVRLGRSEAINAKVKSVTLEELVNAKLSTIAPKEKEDIGAAMQEHQAVSQEMHNLREKMSLSRAKGEVVKPEDENLHEALSRKRKALSNKIDDARERQNTASRDADLKRKQVQQQVLDSAQVLCATLSGSGHEIFQGLNVEFETVIIDEAAQSIELSALIPLKYGCSKCILVGDPKQLPPTVLSREAAKFQYQQSLFARMEKNHPKSVHLLDTQYRMHPAISAYPSRSFYDSRLKDGPEMAQLRRRPWHVADLLGPYRFFDVQGMSSAAPKGHSLVNFAEINVAMQLYERLITDVPQYRFDGKIGVITPYKGQLKALKEHFSGKHGNDILSAVEFNTTDAFQGRESEVIIFSCVRATTNGIGFLQDVRRMNVGLTRAKCSLWVLGNSQSLSQGEYWRGLIEDSKERNVYAAGDIMGMLRRPLLTEDMMKDDVEMLDASNPPPAPLTATATATEAHGSRRDSSSSNQRATQAPRMVQRPASSVSAAIDSTTVPKQSRQFTNRASPKPESKSRGQIRKPSMVNQHPPAPSSMLNSVDAGAYGPSGGRKGLNDVVSCSICGSNAHFSFNCDNMVAKAAYNGICTRCKEAGHASDTCTAPRCVDCGQIGHAATSCRTPEEKKLGVQEKVYVRDSEIAWQKYKARAKEKRAQRQLGDHYVKIPEVKSTSSLAGADGEGKRKRDDGAHLDARNGVKAVKLVERPELQNGSRPAPTADRAQGPGELPSRPTGKIAPPMIRKKKPTETNMFIRRK